jgi:hypothetical protein
VDEANRTGKVICNLTTSQREVRRLHCEEVLRKPVLQLDQQAAGLTGTSMAPAPPTTAIPTISSALPLSNSRATSPIWRGPTKLRQCPEPAAVAAPLTHIAVADPPYRSTSSVTWFLPPAFRSPAAWKSRSW